MFVSLFVLVFVSVFVLQEAGQKSSVESQKGQTCAKIQVWSAGAPKISRKASTTQKGSRLHKKAQNGAGMLYLETGSNFQRTRPQNFDGNPSPPNKAHVEPEAH